MLIHLASKSPRRRELLEQIGVPYTCVSINVPEQAEPGEAPEDYVRRLALTKARAGAELYPDAPVMGADTIVCYEGEILEKPKDKQDAIAMLSKLSGSEHQVMTAVAICYGQRELLECGTTKVSFRSISQQEMSAYWDSAEPIDKAGAYGIQGFGAVFVKEIQGSYSGVVGLPIEIVSHMLSTLSIPVWMPNSGESGRSPHE